jgi:hypothetical protein
VCVGFLVVCLVAAGYVDHKRTRLWGAGSVHWGYLFDFFANDTKGIFALLIASMAGAILIPAVAGLFNKH